MPAGPPTPHLQDLSLPAGSPSSPRGGIWSCTSATAQLEQSTGWSGLGSGTDWTRRRWYTSGQSLVRIYFRQASRPDLGPCSGNHWIWGLRGWMPSPASSLRWQSPDLGPLRLDSVDGSFGARMENNHPSSADSSPSPDRSTGFQAACIAASRHGGCTVLGFSYGSFVVFVACCGVLCVVDSGRGPEADYVFSPCEIGKLYGLLNYYNIIVKYDLTIGCIKNQYDPRVGMVMQMAWYQHQACVMELELRNFNYQDRRSRCLEWHCEFVILNTIEVVHGAALGTMTSLVMEQSS
uniref:Uncharacterized protein n=1 Tax=Oryza rufipogon TaxID=4529 RepID=A0A0E0NDT0_ORYRU